MPNSTNSHIHIIMYGNIVDGVTFIGPFDDFEKVLQFADQYCDESEWVVFDVKSPDKFKNNGDCHDN